MIKEEYLKKMWQIAKDASDNDREASVIEILSVYLKHKPVHGFAWFLYSDALRLVGRLNEAEIALKKALNLVPENKAYMVQERLGFLYSEQSNFEKAEEYYDKALQSEEAAKRGWVWIYRGANFAGARQFSEALKCYQKALTLENADRDEAYLNIGKILRAQGKYLEAKKAYEEALRICPEYPEAQEDLNSLKGIEEAKKLVNNFNQIIMNKND